MVVRYSRIEQKMPGSSPTQFIFFSAGFLLFWLLISNVFYRLSINIYLSREKIVHRILNMNKQSEFLSIPTIYCGKTRVVNHLIIS